MSEQLTETSALPEGTLPPAVLPIEQAAAERAMNEAKPSSPPESAEDD